MSIPVLHLFILSSITSKTVFEWGSSTSVCFRAVLFYQGGQVDHGDPVVLGVQLRYTHNRAAPSLLYRVYAWEYFLVSPIYYTIIYPNLLFLLSLVQTVGITKKGIEKILKDWMNCT